MTDDTMTIRIDLRHRAAIDALVREGRYGSEETFVDEAIRLKLWLEDPPGEREEGNAPAIMAFFESPRGRALLREIMNEELGR